MCVCVCVCVVVLNQLCVVGPVVCVCVCVLLLLLLLNQLCVCVVAGQTGGGSQHVAGCDAHVAPVLLPRTRGMLSCADFVTCQLQFITPAIMFSINFIS